MKKLLKFIAPFFIMSTLVLGQSVMLKTPTLEQVLRKSNDAKALVISNVEMRVISIIIVKTNATAPEIIQTNGNVYYIYNNITNAYIIATNGTISALNYKYNGTNMVPWLWGTIGGTASVYFTSSEGTNYHIRYK